MAKKPNRKTIIKKLDKACGDFVKTRDAYTCVQCGSTKSPSWGHIFSRRHYATRWDLENSFCQCWSCNYRHSFDNYDYYKWFQDRFGNAKFEKLRARYKASVKFTTDDLLELLEHFKKEIKNL